MRRISILLLILFTFLASAAWLQAQPPLFDHVVIIVQENRTPDNLFGGNPNFEPGVDIASSWVNSQGQTMPRNPVGLVSTWDIGHSHQTFLHEYHGGKMDGFSNQSHDYVDNSTGAVQPYFDLAEQYGWANRMFQTNQGPSYPAHQFLVSGSSAPSDDSPLLVSANGQGGTGCDAKPGAWAWTINSQGQYGKIFPCFERSALFNLLDEAGLTWRYYAIGGAWDAPASLESYYHKDENVILHPAQVLTDIASCNLANVVWIIPIAANSDHAGEKKGGGPSWVSSIINAIGSSPCGYWQHTAILITWDDWGGWYDHVIPPAPPANGWGESYVYGFRVPLLVVSAYTPAGYVDNETHDFGSLLKFTEDNFGLGLIGPGTFADSYADDLADFFTLTTPRSFVAIPSLYDANYFINSTEPEMEPDDD